MKILTIFVLNLVLIIALAGCEKTDTEMVKNSPVPIEQGDECHVCGMIINNFPGPKGELYVRGKSQPYKYCSTRDLFSHYLQPEVQLAATQIYVHNMATTEWDRPESDAFINARTAWYVIDHSMKGAMGPTLASFSEESAARAFAVRHGGNIVRFDDISLDILANLSLGTEQGGHAHSHDSGAHVSQ